jgi:hypothetical protein
LVFVDEESARRGRLLGGFQVFGANANGASELMGQWKSRERPGDGPCGDGDGP